MPPENPEQKPNRTYQLVIGFIIAVALLIFIVGGIALLVRIIPDVFSLFSRPESTSQPVTTTSESVIESGQSINLTLEESSDERTYYITYFCEAGVRVEYQDEILPCDEPFTIATRETALPLTVFSTQRRETDVFLILEIKHGEDIFVLSETELTVKNDDVDVEEENEENTEVDDQRNSGNVQGVSTSTPPTTTTPAPSDLSVRIISSPGLVRSGQFTTVQFEISNLGETPTGSWSFEASLPAERSEDRNFISTNQQSIPAHGRIVYTLSFTLWNQSSGAIVIQVDPRNNIKESNETNNQAALNLQSLSGGTSTSGDADLAISNIEVGIIGSGSRFIETRNIDTRDEVAVRFRVTNRGGKSTGRWKFDAVIEDPDSDETEFSSKNYASLAPGESLDITFTLDDIEDEGDYSIEIELDPDRDVDEKTRSNNDAEIEFEIED